MTHEEDDYFPSPLHPPLGALTSEEQYSYLLRCIQQNQSAITDLAARLKDVEGAMDEEMDV